MNKTRKIFIGIFISLIFSGSAVADYTIYGEGVDSSCGEWVNDRKIEYRWNPKAQWMFGVISAVGYYSVHDIKDTDSHALLVWMDNYCQKNPLNKFSEGVYSLVEELTIKKPE